MRASSRPAPLGKALGCPSVRATWPLLSLDQETGLAVQSEARRGRAAMAEADLQTFTSIMDALVRISVSMTRIS